MPFLIVKIAHSNKRLCWKGFRDAGTNLRPEIVRNRPGAHPEANRNPRERKCDDSEGPQRGGAAHGNPNEDPDRGGVKTGICIRGSGDAAESRSRFRTKTGGGQKAKRMPRRRVSVGEVSVREVRSSVSVR